MAAANQGDAARTSGGVLPPAGVVEATRSVRESAGLGAAGAGRFRQDHHPRRGRSPRQETGCARRLAHGGRGRRARPFRGPSRLCVRARGPGSVAGQRERLDGNAAHAPDRDARSRDRGACDALPAHRGRARTAAGRICRSAGTPAATRPPQSPFRPVVPHESGAGSGRHRSRRLGGRRDHRAVSPHEIRDRPVRRGQSDAAGADGDCRPHGGMAGSRSHRPHHADDRLRPGHRAGQGDHPELPRRAPAAPSLRPGPRPAPRSGGLRVDRYERGRRSTRVDQHATAPRRASGAGWAGDARGSGRRGAASPPGRQAALSPVAGQPGSGSHAAPPPQDRRGPRATRPTDSRVASRGRDGRPGVPGQHDGARRRVPHVAARGHDVPGRGRPVPDPGAAGGIPAPRPHPLRGPASAASVRRSGSAVSGHQAQARRHGPAPRRGLPSGDAHRPPLHRSQPGRRPLPVEQRRRQGGDRGPCAGLRNHRDDAAARVRTAHVPLRLRLPDGLLRDMPPARTGGALADGAGRLPSRRDLHQSPSRHGRHVPGPRAGGRRPVRHRAASRRPASPPTPPSRRSSTRS